MSLVSAGVMGSVLAMGKTHHSGSGTKKHAHGLTAVSVAMATSGHVSSSLVLSGVVQPVSAVNLAPSVSGRIGAINVVVGQKVVKGQTIASLTDSMASAQLAQAQAAVLVAQAKLEAATQGATPQAIQVAQAAVNKAVQAFNASKSAYQAAEASYQDRIPEQQAVISAQNQVTQTEAAVKVAQANVAAAEVKLHQAESAAQTSSTQVLPSTITADQQAVVAAQAQLENDQGTLQTDQTAVQTATTTLASDQKTYGAMASQYTQDEQAYQQALLNYNSWNGYGTNPYTGVLNKTQSVAQQAAQAYNVLQTDKNSLQSAQETVAQMQKTLLADQAAVDSAQASLKAAQNSLTGQQAANQLSIEAAQTSVQQAQAQAAQTAAALASAKADLAQAQAQFNDRTSANQTLLQFKNAEASAEASVQEAQAQLAETKAGPSSGTVRLLQAGVSQAQAAENVLVAQLQRNVIKAPFSGVITAVTASVGSLVSPGSPVVSMTTSAVQIQAALSQQDLLLVNPGDAVSVTVPGSPTSLAAKVAAVSPTGNASSLAFTVTVTPQTIPAWLRPGEFASLTVVSRTYDNAVIIPESAISDVNGTPQVFAVGKGHTVALKNVTTVLSNGSYAMVSGLSPGSKVVVAGQTYLTKGSRVKITQIVHTPSSFQGAAIGGFVADTPSGSATATPSSKRGAAK